MYDGDPALKPAVNGRHMISKKLGTVNATKENHRYSHPQVVVVLYQSWLFPWASEIVTNSRDQHTIV